MSRKLISEISLLLIVVFLIAGCSPKYARTREADAYLVADVSGFGEEKFIFGVIFANRIMDCAEGGDGRISWPVFVFDEDGTYREYLATDYSELDFRFWKVWFDNSVCMKKFVLVLPANEAGKKFVIVNRAGNAIYNMAGEERKIDPYADINPKDHQGFMSVIDLDNPAFKHVDQNSEISMILKSYLVGCYAPTIKNELQYAYKTYGTLRSKKQWDEIAKLDERIGNLKKWAGQDWYGVIGIPLVSVETRLLQMSIIKLIRIPEAFSKVNKPGYATYQPNTGFTAGMIERFIRLYGRCAPYIDAMP